MSSIRGTNARDDWRTPEELLELVRKVAPIRLDPCSTPSNPTAAYKWLTLDDDGLTWNWRSFVNAGEIAFVNPPYNKTWYKKIKSEMLAGTPMIALLMAKPGTKWFQSLAELAHVICFWRGRITFDGAPDPAPFDSALFYHGPHPRRFRNVFHDKGWIVGKG